MKQQRSFLVALCLMALSAATGAEAAPLSDLGCDPEPPEYYAIELFTTKNILGTARATGSAEVTFASSPFAVSVAEDGSYAYDIAIAVERMERPASGTLVAWLTTPQLNEIDRLGPLDEQLSVVGSVRWNKFLVVVSLESADDAAQPRWSGPIVLRGMSRSGMMHTMAGHGPFETENCAAFGYGG